ncbi:MAG: hypothetical protein ACRDIC_05980 [bacterium]
MATLAMLDGFEHGNAASGVGGVYDSVAGTPTMVTSPVRSGLRSLEIGTAAATENVQYSVASQIVTQSAYVRFAALPSTDADLLFFQKTGDDGYFKWDVTSGRFALSIAGGAGDAPFGPSTVSINTWYRVVVEYDTSTTTAIIRARLDGGPEGSTTKAITVANIFSVDVGTKVTTETYTVYVDDWIVSVTDGDYEEISGTWTNHEVQSLIPNADGTHNIAVAGDFDSFVGTAFANSTTNGNSFIGHRPLQLANTADQVIRQELGATTDYMEFLMEDLAAGSLIPFAVRAYAAHIESADTGASLGEARLLLSDNTEVLTTGSVSAINSTEDPGIAVTLRKRMTIAPSGGWTRTNVNGVKARVGFADGDPDVNFTDLMVEVALQESPTGAASILAKTQLIYRG